MLEMLIGKSSNVRCLDWDTGPGSNCMQYDPDDDSGFFGEVSNSELISGSDLSTLVNLTAGTLVNDDGGWFKFYLDGKILFISIFGFRHNLTRIDMDNVNIVSGNRVINVKNYNFKIRLLSGTNKDPFDSSGVIDDTSVTNGSEWDRTLLRIYEPSKIHPGSTAKFGTFAKYTNDDLRLSLQPQYFFCKDQRRTSSNGTARRSGPNDLSSFNAVTKDFLVPGYGWRPVLELVE